MSNSNGTTLRPRGAEHDEVYYNDQSGPRIRAYLAAVRPLRNTEAGHPQDFAYHRGRTVIERMAMAAGATEAVPQVNLTTAQCADVLFFLSNVEPLAPRDFFTEPEDAPSHLCGLTLVYWTLEAALRQQPRKRGAA